MIFKVNDKTGLKNFSGEVILPAEYDSISPFFGGLAKVCRDGKYALVDTKGEFVTGGFHENITTRCWGEKGYIHVISRGKRLGFIIGSEGSFSGFLYEEIGDLHHGRAMVRVSGKTGYIDETGREVIPPKYDKGTPFEHGFATVTHLGKVFTINPFGEPWEVDDYGFLYRQPARMQVADMLIGRKLFGLTNTRPLAAEDFLTSAAWELYQLLTPGSLFTGNLGLITVLFTRDKRFCSPKKSRGIKMISPDRFIFTIDYGYREDAHKLYGVADISGRVLVRPVFTEITPIDEEKFIVVIKERYGVINTNGTFHQPPLYDSANDIPGIGAGDLPEEER